MTRMCPGTDLRQIVHDINILKLYTKQGTNSLMSPLNNDRWTIVCWLHYPDLPIGLEISPSVSTPTDVKAHDLEGHGLVDREVK